MISVSMTIRNWAAGGKPEALATVIDVAPPSMAPTSVVLARLANCSSLTASASLCSDQMRYPVRLAPAHPTPRRGVKPGESESVTGRHERAYGTGIGEKCD